MYSIETQIPLRTIQIFQTH